MIETKRRPLSGGEMLTAEFLEPLGLTQGALAAAMSVPRKLSMNCVTGAGRSPPIRR